MATNRSQDPWPPATDDAALPAAIPGVGRMSQLRRVARRQRNDEAGG
ncbi:MAG: hypothetical protein ACXV3F_12630 [Frankiaceae bacterium]